MQWTLRLLSTNLPQTTNPVYINRVKQMSDMSYTLEQFDQDKQTLLNLIADCEELEKRENGDEFFINATNLPKISTLFDMNFPTSTVNVLPHLDELRDTWRQQDFRFTKDQQDQYDMLMQARRERVRWFYETNRVQVGPKVTKKVEEVQEDQDS